MAAIAIKVTQKGDFTKTKKYLERAKKMLHVSLIDKLNKYGEQGVEALSAATPIDTGTTAASWRYEIQENEKGAVLSFHNDNINKHVNIALILQYGHGTGTGGWVEGRDYINPAIQPIFDKIAEEAGKEVSRL